MPTRAQRLPSPQYSHCSPALPRSRTLTLRKCRDTEECLQRHRRPTSNNSSCALAQAASQVKARGTVRPLLSARRMCYHSSLSLPSTTSFLEWNAGGACAPTKASSFNQPLPYNGQSLSLLTYHSMYHILVPFFRVPVSLGFLRLLSCLCISSC